MRRRRVGCGSTGGRGKARALPITKTAAPDRIKAVTAMTIDLDSETEKLLQRELQAGQFSDAAALLSVALKQFLIAKEFGEAEARKLAVLRAELDHADGQIERGEYTEYE